MPWLSRSLLVAAATLASLPGCGAAAGQFQPAATRDGMLAGMIRTADTGAPVDDAIVVLRRQGELAPVQERTTGTGAYMIARLAPGRYQVKVYRDERTVGDEDVAIVAGRVTGLDLAIGPRLPEPDRRSLDVASGTPLWRYRPTDGDAASGAIEGTVSEDAARLRLGGAVVTVADREGRLVADGVTDDEGRYRFDRVPPGVYVVSAYYTLIGRAQFEIRRGEVVVEPGVVVVVPLVLETDGT